MSGFANYLATMDFLADLCFYVLSFFLITWVGNVVCRDVLRLANIPKQPAAHPPAAGTNQTSLKAGRVIGSLERLLILIGLVAHSWEVMVAVITLKTVARYQELDKQIEAEYFLIGSLTSILWAVAVTVFVAHYDAAYGWNISSHLAKLGGE